MAIQTLRTQEASRLAASLWERLSFLVWRGRDARTSELDDLLSRAVWVSLGCGSVIAYGFIAILQQNLWPQAIILGLGAALLSVAPLWAWRLAVIGGLIDAVLIPFDGGGYPIWTAMKTIVFMLVLARLGYRHHGTVAGIGLVGLVLALLIPTMRYPSLLVGTLVVAAILVAATVAGSMLGERRTTSATLTEQRQVIENATIQQTLLTERARIARELHDVVAHHMSMVAVRAETAPYRLIDATADVRVEFREIGAAARSALSDMRQLLGVLRDGQSLPDKAPQPGVAQIPDLVSAAAASGVNISSGQSGESIELPSAVDLAAYRIVQEALSNAGRHAPGAAISVRLDYRQTELLVSVTNGPASSSGPPAGRTGDTGSAVTLALGQNPSLTGALRHGLVGMKERVALVSGSLLACPTPDGGFLVEVTMPYSLPHTAAEPVE
jgi:signal transduction histidine kinase